jgi:hypothetical protein
MGFLFKIVLVAALVAGVGWVVYTKPSGLSLLSSIVPGSAISAPSKISLNQDAVSSLKNFDLAAVTQQISSSLDALVTHSGTNSPVVLGVKISNDSLNTVVDVIQKLPPDQIDQLKSAICK